MPFVYILYSLSKRNVYVGCTTDFMRRFKAHQRGSVKSTKDRRPFVLIHLESYSTLSLARKREGYLKSLYGSRERKKILDKYLRIKALCKDS